MSRITEIVGTHIKGASFTLPLAMANILLGPNKAGKTAVLNAIQLALMKHVPGFDKTNAGIHEAFASANAFNVCLTTDDGQQAERAWSLQGGTVSYNERITIPDLGDVPLVMLDANEFLSKSEQKRLEMIFAVMNLGATPLKERIAEVRKRFSGEEDARTLQALKSLVEIPNENFQRWLERVIDHVAQEKRSEDAIAKKREATCQTLSQQQLSTPAVAFNTEELKNALDAAEKVLEQKRTAKADVESLMKANAGVHNRRVQLRDENNKLQPLALRLEELQTERSAIMTKLSELEQDEKPLAYYYDAQQAAAIANSKAGQLVDHLLEVITELDEEESQVMDHATCPTCDANKPTWKKKAAAKFEARRGSLHEKLGSAKDAEGQAHDVLQNAKQAVTDATLAADKLTEVRRVLTELGTTHDEAARAAKTIQANIAELATLKEGEDDGSKLENAECEYQDAFEEAKALRDQQQAVANQQADAKQLEQSAKERELAKANSASLVLGLKLLQQTRDNFMQSGIKPLLDIANIFTLGILDGPLVCLGGAIGRIKKGRFISSRSFSGMEQIATHAALSAALGSQSPLKLVLLDELTRMDKPSKAKFLHNVLGALAAKVIDQFIAADIEDDVYTEINSEALKSSQSAPLHLIKLG